MFKPTRFNDGTVAIYREKQRTTDFNARRNVASLDDLDPVLSLAYQESSRRQQDLDFAEQSGFRLTYKIRTRYNPEVRSRMKAVINGYLYDIAHVDTTRTEMFLYLEGVREIA